MSKARDLANFISSPTVEATEIANGAITSDKIANTAVTADKLHTTLDLSSKTLTFANDHLSGDNIHGGVISDFQSTGIDDNSTGTVVVIDSSNNVLIQQPMPILELTSQTPNATLGDIGDKGAKVLFRQDSSVAGQGTEIVWAGNADEGGERWAAISGWIRGNDVNGCIGDLQFSTKELSTANTMSERMRICANGNIGINSSNPQGALSVVGEIIAATGDNSTSGISISSNATAGYASSILHSDIGIQFNTGASSRNFTFETGRVFIGDTNNVDSTILQVTAPTGYTIASGFFTDSAASTIQFKDANTSGNYYVRIGSIGDELALFAANAERVRISATSGSEGRVGIGNTTPIHALHIFDANNDPNFRRMAIESTSNAGGNGGYRLILKSPNGTTRAGGYYYVPGDTTATTYLGLSSTDSNYALVATAENKVGIGTTSPDYTLHVVGDSNLKRNDHYGSVLAEYSKWRNPGNAYVYDATNGTRYYYYKIGYFLSSTTSRITIEYEAKDDVNYPGFVKGTIAIGHWAENAFNVQHDTSTVSGGGTPEVYVDNNHAVWLRFNGITWNSHWRYRIHQASGTFTPLDSWTLGTDYLDTANTSHTTPPAGSTGAIYPGENVRITWSGASPNTLNTPTKPTYNFYKELGKYRAGSQHHIHGTPGTGAAGAGGLADRFALSARSRNTLTFSNSRITVPSSGLYLITFTTIQTFGDTRADTIIYINGSSYCNGLSQEPKSGYTSSSTGYRYRGLSTVVQLASSDYIQFYHESPYTHGNSFDSWQTASVTQIA